MTSPPPMIDVTMGRSDPSLVDRSGQTVDEGEAHPELSFEANVLRRRVGDDEERRCARLIRAVSHVLVPTPRAVDDVEQPPPHDHGTTLRRSPFEDLGVDRVLFRHPRVELRRVAEPVLFVGTGPGHVPVKRHGDIGDHLGHCRLLSVTISRADSVQTANSSRRRP
jgi:hypothetical protein